MFRILKISLLLLFSLSSCYAVNLPAITRWSHAENRNKVIVIDKIGDAFFYGISSATHPTAQASIKLLLKNFSKILKQPHQNTLQQQFNALFEKISSDIAVVIVSGSTIKTFFKGACALYLYNQHDLNSLYCLHDSQSVENNALHFTLHIICGGIWKQTISAEDLKNLYHTAAEEVNKDATLPDLYTYMGNILFQLFSIKGFLNRQGSQFTAHNLSNFMRTVEDLSSSPSPYNIDPNLLVHMLVFTSSP